MKKIYEYTCPECESDELETVDMEMDEDRMSIKLCCDRCDTVWRENFKIIYDGYEYKGKGYSADGGQLW